MLLGDTVLTADEYQDVRFFCDAASDSPVWYAWSVMSPRVHFTVIMPGKAVGNIGVSLDGKVLTITSVRQEDAGGYICMATSRLGGSTVSHQLIVNAQESPTTQSQTTLELRDQELVTEITTTPLPMDMAPPNEACVEILHRGHCFRQEVKWFYNMQSQRCEPFVYGGCGGNSNRFATYEQCSRACPNLPFDPCKHPIATGRCRAHLRRWAYQEDTGECVQFVYGGCGANGNNFGTREECGYTCQDREAKKTNCECVRPKLKSSYCRSDFVIIGRIRQEISSTANGALLVIELQKLYKAPEAFPIRLGDHAYNITIVRDMSRTPRGCHCLSFTFDESFIFMGRIDEHGRAILDDNSYVSPSNGKRNARIRTSIRCNGNEENSLQGPRGGGARREGANVERRQLGVDDVVNVERELDANRFIVKPMALPVYQRKNNENVKNED
ncbi:putative WAP, Kazal, immunoglobulin, Kunitz and NTR domain-containing protein 2-like [Apostichopus japonicus]|uniref:Putative WAP, Kazal, immunoglobulin, Kunitz and NTR domain-containing protein 2-like n=1 Tax=Stichopus japonicus TaxID=307972 RepID=A0A2G8LPB4_STIJA|nr:putative WAP, Kazal, immunoglobulin, Kunitz and NTR domain-containing protein 2-like [Apostichopus japonicus]